jgi:SAM-dependent methyltransferase
VLEVGVGTGQLALPLHEAGVDVTGIDLARPMLDVLVEKAGGRVPFPLAIADATRQPFAGGSFGAAYLRWVLHLIPAWKDAIAETIRVLRPGAVFLVCIADYGSGPTARIKEHFTGLVGTGRHRPVGLDWGSGDSLDEVMAAHGATWRDLPRFEDPETTTAEGFIRGIEANAYSWTWSMDDGARLAAAAATRAWAEAEMGPLDEVPRRTYPVDWRAYDLP